MTTRAAATLRNAKADRSVGLCLVPATSEGEPLTGLPGEVASVVSKVTAGKRRVRAGEFLFRAGTPFHNLYVVRAGMFKSILLDSEGREQVTGFLMTGEVLGLDGIEK